MAILYYVTIRSGAVAYSPDGARNWGQISDPFRERAGVVAEGVGGNKLRIGEPLWNGREWCVLQADTTLYAPPPPDPDPTEPTTPAGSLVVNLPDGAQLVNRDPIVWVEKSLG